MLNKIFSNCFNHHSAPLEVWSESDFKLTDDSPDELLCDEDTMCELLASLDVSNSSDPDGISAKMLKHTAVSIALLTHSSSTRPSEVAEYLEAGNCHQLNLFLSWDDLAHLIIADQYPC